MKSRCPESERTIQERGPSQSPPGTGPVLRPSRHVSQHTMSEYGGAPGPSLGWAGVIFRHRITVFPSFGTPKGFLIRGPAPGGRLSCSLAPPSARPPLLRGYCCSLNKVLQKTPELPEMSQMRNVKHGAPGWPAGLPLSPAVWGLWRWQGNGGDEGLGVIEELLQCLLTVPRQCPEVAASPVHGLPPLPPHTPLTILRCESPAVPAAAIEL